MSCSGGWASSSPPNDVNKPVATAKLRKSVRALQRQLRDGGRNEGARMRQFSLTAHFARARGIVSNWRMLQPKERREIAAGVPVLRALADDFLKLAEQIEAAGGS